MNLENFRLFPAVANKSSLIKRGFANAYDNNARINYLGKQSHTNGKGGRDYAEFIRNVHLALR